MPQPALSRAHVESDHRRLDELIAFVGGLNSDEAALLMEHLIARASTCSAPCLMNMRLVCSQPRKLRSGLATSHYGRR